MLQTFLAQLVWVPALLGWGGHLQNHLKKEEWTESLGVLGFLGLLVLAFLGLLFNFFSALRIEVTTGAWIVGLILFLFLFKIRFDDFRKLLALLVVIFLVSLYAGGSQQVFDTGRYYFPNLVWNWKDKVPLGLANLHDHYAFNSIWYVQASMLRLPFFGDKSAFALNPIATSLFWMTLVEWFQEKKGALSLTFLLAVFLIFEGTLPAGSGTLSNDVGAALLTLVVFLLDAKMLEDGEGSYLWLAYLFGLLATLIKISQLPILILTGFVQFSVGKPRISKRALTLIVALSIFWLARSFLLSGCLLYPNELTCVGPKYWSIPTERVRDLRLGIRQFSMGAMQGEKLPANWFSLWARDMIHLRIVQLVVAFVALGSLGEIVRRRSPALGFEWLLFLGIIFGMVNAPAPRFSYAFWAALGVYSLYRSLRGFTLPIWVSRACYVCLALFVLRRSYVRVHEPDFRWVALPAIPEVVTNPTLSVKGATYFRPHQGNCWASAPPCTDENVTNLVIERARDGRWIFRDVH